MITLRKKIGQMLIMGFSGTEAHKNSAIAHWLAEDGLGGVILFDKDLSTGQYGKNLQDQAQIKQLITELKQYAAVVYDEEDTRLPLLTAIDYEGGAVDRLTKIEDCMATMSAESMTHLSHESLKAELEQMALTLQALGFNLNFAPVVDLKVQNEKGIIGALGRSFSADPQIVAAMAKQFVHVFHQHGIASCYKHFPGHGSAIGDTHEGFVDVTQTFQNEELLPYVQLVKEPTPTMIMTAHVVNKNLDSQGLPATLSYEILTGLLRQEMGYEGIIISDDLQMEAIASHYDIDEALCLTINAGADMLIFANQLGFVSAPEVIERIEALVLAEKISLARIEEAYRRIVRLKQQID